jgi:membrane protease YdiL (CAAX protease family)
MDDAATAIRSRATGELRHEPLVSGRDHIFLASLAAISGLSSLPLYRLIGGAFAHRIRFAESFTAGRLFGFYLYVTLITIAVRYGEGILGTYAAKRSGLTPLPVVDAPSEKSELALGRLIQGVPLGILCAFIAILINGTQFFVFGMSPGSLAKPSPSLLHRHNYAMRRMGELDTWRSALLLYVGAPIGEEIECRLLLFSVVVWLGQRLARRYQWLGRGIITWTAVALSGVAFGMLHVVGGQGVTWWRPLYQQVFVDARTYVGLILAWVYWKRGLETSIIAHGTMNFLIIIALGAAVVLVRLLS